MKSALRASIIFSLLANIFEGTVRADWPQFRGVNSSGIAAGPAPPIQFGPGKNELWRVPIGVGHSSPCIVGQSIFLTTFNKKTRTLAVVCLDRSDGEVRWTKGVPTDSIEKGHPSFNPASSTPACDGERVVAYFGSYGLICFDIAGAKQWDVKMKLARSFSGNATSPIIVGDKVILYRGNYVDHFLMAVDKRSGKDIWKVKQPERFSPDMAGTSTPIVAGDKLIVHSARAVQAVDIETGKQIWKMRCSTTATSTPVVAGDEVIVATWHQTGETSQIPALSTFEKLLEDRDRNKDGVIDGKEFPRLMIFHRSEGTDAPKNGFPLRMGMVDRNEDGQVDKEETERLIETFLEASTPKAILLRMLSNLRGVAEEDRDLDSILRYLDTALVIEPDSLDTRARRIDMRIRSGRIPEALIDIDWMLDKRPEGMDVNQVLQLRANLEAQLQR